MKLYGKEKNVIIVILMIAMISIPGIPVKADMGPKPELTIIVTNPPEEEYYLDLLIQEEHEYQNLDHPEDYDPGMLALLDNYQEDGWEAAYVKGTQAPMWGDLVGEKTELGMKHTFGYMGVPDYFRIIIVTSDHNLKVSLPTFRKQLQETIYYDYETGIVTRDKYEVTFGMQFLSTFLPTIMIEGVILVLFGFSLRNNWRLFLLMNLITQVLLTITLGVSIEVEGMSLAYIVFVPMELLIVVAERIAFIYLGKGHDATKRSTYAITANLCSAFAGLLIVIITYLIKTH
ncbi:MAG: hypothetical protein K0S47_147 [Herbinix sp.]|jgi:hypothetical protein|nr:hypothetical protein [Herbinix sp.]